MKGLKRKIAGLCGGALLALCCSLPVQAGTITFDEHVAGTSLGSGPYAGVTFLPLSGSSSGGIINSAGTWGLTGTNGQQFASWTAGPNQAGVQIMFDTPIVEFTIDFALGTSPTTTGTIYVEGYFGDSPVYEGNWGLTSSWKTGGGDIPLYVDLFNSPIDRIMISFSSSVPGTLPPNIGFDNIGYTSVPVPASLLLLGSGLVPFVLRRKK